MSSVQLSAKSDHQAIRREKIIRWFRYTVVVVWFIDVFTCLIWFDCIAYDGDVDTYDKILTQKRLGEVVDSTSTSLSFISLLFMSVALVMIACYVHRMQQIMPGKLTFNLPLFALHGFMMSIDCAMRITGDAQKYGHKSKDLFVNLI